MWIVIWTGLYGGPRGRALGAVTGGVTCSHHVFSPRPVCVAVNEMRGAALCCPALFFGRPLTFSQRNVGVPIGCHLIDMILDEVGESAQAGYDVYGEGTVALFSQRDGVGTHGEEGADALDVAAGQGEVEGCVFVVIGC